jgi:hypothetical protein
LEDAHVGELNCRPARDLLEEILRPKAEEVTNGMETITKREASNFELHQNQGDKVNGDGRGSTCSTNGRDEKYIHDFSNNMKEGDHLVDLGTDGRILN